MKTKPFARRMTYHPDSPVKASEVKIDATDRTYVIRDGIAYRIKSRAIEIRPRVFRQWVELGEAIEESHPASI